MLNIIFICVDQMRADTIGSLGNKSISTPNLDRLIEDGVAFTNHYSVSSPCCPARTSLLTGQYPARHGSITKEHPLRASTNLALEVRKLGMPCVLFGFTDSVTKPHVIGGEGIMPGFDVHTYMNLHNEGLTSWASDLRAKGYAVPEDIMEIYKADEAPYTAEDSDTAFLTNKVIDFLRGQGRSFGFLHVSYFRPHPPFIAPKPYSQAYEQISHDSPSVGLESFLSAHPIHAQLYAQAYRGEYRDMGYAEVELKLKARALEDKRAYYGLISELDFQLGRLLNVIKNKGLYDDTLIIFTSDHGEMLGDNWLQGKGGYFNSSFHVPLIIKPPARMGELNSGRVYDGFTSSIDLMPTVLKLLDAAIPKTCQGKSMVEILKGNADPGDLRTMVFFENYESQSPGVLSRTLTVKDNAYKYVFSSAFDDLLFNLTADPAELHNLASEPAHSAAVHYYREQLRAEGFLINRHHS
jgi:arylsulfatase A-like enzyme